MATASHPDNRIFIKTIETDFKRAFCTEMTSRKIFNYLIYIKILFLIPAPVWLLNC